jgi:phosphoribosyl-ATP pyrophosphohydrolase
MTHNRTITESKVQQLSTLKYGISQEERTLKMQEEFGEFIQAEFDYMNNPTMENKSKVVDELSDIAFVFISKLHAYDTNIRELAEMAIYKIKQREIDQNFKRDGKDTASTKA